MNLNLRCLELDSFSRFICVSYSEKSGSQAFTSYSNSVKKRGDNAAQDSAILRHHKAKTQN